MSNTTDQFGKQAKEVTEDLQQMGRTVRDAAQAKLGQVGEKAAEYSEQAQDKLHGLACACEQFVRERPLRSVLMAAGIGWLLGRFWKGR
ncbi:MAG: YqjD family protein [Thermoguttaceae bacterium]